MISIIGHFGENKTLLNGQTVKTKIVTEALQERFGCDKVVKYDSYGGTRILLKAPVQAYSAMKNSGEVIIFPAQNGLRVYVPLLATLKTIFKSRHIHYVVIGGWLPAFLKNRRWLKNLLRKFDGIYVETNTMKQALESQGFNNIYVMPNCKKLTVLSEDELVYPQGVPYRLCTFSRVMKEKGIETAVDVISRVNEQLGYTAFSLDIYGQIWDESKAWFEALQSRFPAYVRYCGAVDADKSVETLSGYFALLFPTHFYTEGIPGTIIDAYAAGIPVISAKWESYDDVVNEGVTGIGYEFDDEDALESVLIDVARNPKSLLDMKENCINKAKNYIPETAVNVIAEKIGGGYNLYPLKLCTFSRVMREKGIEDAVKVVTAVNQSLGRVVFSLDIYGQVDENQTEWFDALQKSFPDFIRYGGLIPFDQSVETLKEYFALLFPTYYEGEGFAGTLIDAYSAGVPVIASDWRYNAELVNEEVGYIYKTQDNAAFEDLLKLVAVDPTMILKKKKACLREAEEYKIENALSVLLNRIEGD